jgi:hypothetical protein
MGAKKWARKNGHEKNGRDKNGREKRTRIKRAHNKGRELQQLDHLEKDSFNLILLDRLH